ncbi:TIGR02234 family membrane protein [Streptomyces sp. NPDC046977]|uniref:TIGR02234 family membrane protein n=1 Tax=Streptomyces sp. NPDC046977 TaxID=3154703 RepID=UPI0033C68729
MTSAVPQPRADADAASTAVPPGPHRAGGRRSMAVALAGGALGAALVLLAAGKTWQHGFAGAAGAGVAVHADGSQVTAVPGALALVGLASLVAVFAVRGAARRVVSALLALCGAGALLAALLTTGDASSLDAAAAAASGLTRATATDTATTAWPAVSVVGGALLLLAGVTAVLRAAAWPGMSSRYERDGGAAARPAGARKARTADGEERPEDIWKALDRGEDPTDAR